MDPASPTTSAYCAAAYQRDRVPVGTGRAVSVSWTNRVNLHAGTVTFGFPIGVQLWHRVAEWCVKMELTSSTRTTRTVRTGRAAVSSLSWRCIRTFAKFDSTLTISRWTGPRSWTTSATRTNSSCQAAVLPQRSVAAQRVSTVSIRGAHMHRTSLCSSVSSNLPLSHLFVSLAQCT